MEIITTDVLVVGGGTGGTVAAIQAARCGVDTILVSEFSWLGGMLTAAGVAAPDGNELAAWQTGIWGAYLKELKRRQAGGLDWSWVSLFAYDPRLGADIFADWVRQLPNLHWIRGQKPQNVLLKRNTVTGVEFEDYIIEAKITLDGTELGDLLALGNLPYRWGWELQTEFNELSAPIDFNSLSDRFAVQAPTWVFLLQDYGEHNLAPQITSFQHTSFAGTWDNYGGEHFLNYGRLSDNLFMINWPLGGNDYGKDLNRLIKSDTEARQFRQEAYHHSFDFAHYIQSQLGQRYGLARDIFPNNFNNAFALHPYYRESRRLKGQVTITENDILPLHNGAVAPLPKTNTGEISAIAIGNYVNDHHYPGEEFTLQPKSIHWGGRWTGTPFTIPYGALFSEAIEGFLVCEKNISVSHIANGSTRLQPVVMNIGQAAGMAAAMCVQANCQPWELSIRTLQEALLSDRSAPATIIPLFNLPPEHPDWLKWQRYYLDRPEAYLADGNCSCSNFSVAKPKGNYYRGVFDRDGSNYQIILIEPVGPTKQWQLITIYPEVERKLREYPNQKSISLVGQINTSGNWLLVEAIL